MERKYLDRREWTRVEKRRQRLIRMEAAALCGYAAAIWIDRVKSPLVKTIGGRRLTLADAGYLWVQLLPDGEKLGAHHYV